MLSLLIEIFLDIIILYLLAILIDPIVPGDFLMREDKYTVALKVQRKFGISIWNSFMVGCILILVYPFTLFI